MTDTPEGNRNAILELHFEEGDTREAAAHVLVCAACREYREALRAVDDALQAWADEDPPPGMAEAVLARATSAPQLPAPARGESNPALLVALLPAMAAVVAVVRSAGARLVDLSYWDVLAPWPSLQLLAPFAAAAAGMLLLGGLASLAIAPVLVLENRKS